jgi:hypothetical protein
MLNINKSHKCYISPTRMLMRLRCGSERKKKEKGCASLRRGSLKEVEKLL